MNNVKEIQRLNAREATLSTSHSQTGSWHEQYKDSAHVFVGGLPYHLTEGDIICVVSQFGEVAGINLVRDKDTGKSKGYAFLKYVDQRSTILAVDNLNGAQIAGRTIRVDHVQNYKVPKVFDADGNEIEPDEDTVNNAAPKAIQDDASDDDDDESSESEVDNTGIDIDDPMREYLLKKRKKDARKAKRKAEKEAGKSSESKAEKKARKELKKAAKRDKDGGSGGSGKKSKDKSSSIKDKDGRESSPLPSSGTKALWDDSEVMDVIDSKKDEQLADKTQKDSSITDRNTTINKDTLAGGEPPLSSLRQDRRRSRSRSPRPRSRSRSPRSRQRSTDRRRGRSQSRERYRTSNGGSGGGRDDYNSGRNRRRGNSRERGRDDSRERSIDEIPSRDGSKDRKLGIMDDPYSLRRHKESSQRRASPESSHRRRRDDYDRGSKYRRRSRSPPPRRAGAGDRRRSRSRSPERH
ncbi:hypothetical protein BGZ96_012452 [Linnemannia gamsii]|uniref:RRM domain-containing protein n=1 Tax=Linnemannia gamsii TaxID=64522 RepID=A0ABQ7JQR5_9FUNG|nr:hypothetical protein BGZ96_012452 [Linnemannia gamsii]